MQSHQQTNQDAVYSSSKATQFQPASPLQKKKERAVVVGTGGTIVGVAATATTATYAPSQLSIAEVLATMPELQNFEEKIEATSLFKVDSNDMTSTHWLTLAKKVNELLLSEDVKGVVITHGTDTLEETAYFLDLVVKSDKPVVIVGAMRAATSMSADGPMNLYNALAVIHAPESVGRGVMVVMNDKIYDGRNVTKCNTTQVNTFNAPNTGSIGDVCYGKVEFKTRVVRKHTTETPFDISNLDTLPTVEIVYEHAGTTGNVLKAVVAQEPDGIVIAGMGDGNVHASDKAFLRFAREQLGIQIIRSSRTGSGRVTDVDNDLKDYIPADDLNPQKARILLMLSLTQTKLSNEIKKNFSVY